MRSLLQREGNANAVRDLAREWNRIGSPGTVRCDSFASEEQARESERRINRTRVRWGYR